MSLYRRHAIEPVHESTSFVGIGHIALLYCCTCTYGCLSSFLIKLGASLNVATVVYFVRVRHADDSQISVGWRCVCSECEGGKGCTGCTRARLCLWQHARHLHKYSQNRTQTHTQTHKHTHESKYASIEMHINTTPRPL